MSGRKQLTGKSAVTGQQQLLLQPQTGGPTLAPVYTINPAHNCGCGQSVEKKGGVVSELYRWVQWVS